MRDVASSTLRNDYRWLLLSGWFVLFSTIFSFVIAAPLRPQAADGVLMSLAMLAFIDGQILNATAADAANMPR